MNTITIDILQVKKRSHDSNAERASSNKPILLLKRKKQRIISNQESPSLRIRDPRYTPLRDAFPIVWKGVWVVEGGWNNLCKSLLAKKQHKIAQSEGRYLHAAIIMMHLSLTFRIHWLPCERMGDGRRKKNKVCE